MLHIEETKTELGLNDFYHLVELMKNVKDSRSNDYQFSINAYMKIVPKFQQLPNMIMIGLRYVIIN